MLGVVLLLAGCVSKKQAELQAHQAYMAGQAQAAKQWQAEKPPQVVVQGPVSNHVIPWTEGLTLAQLDDAQAMADRVMTPKLVRVVRNGQLIESLKGIDLLHHEDVPLEAGDIVNIVP